MPTYACEHQLGNAPCGVCAAKYYYFWGMQPDHDLPEKRQSLPSSETQSDQDNPKAKAHSNAKTVIGDLKRGLVSEPVVREVEEACKDALRDAGVGRALGRR